MCLFVVVAFVYSLSFVACCLLVVGCRVYVVVCCLLFVWDVFVVCCLFFLQFVVCCLLCVACSWLFVDLGLTCCVRCVLSVAFCLLVVRRSSLVVCSLLFFGSLFEVY